MEAHMTKRLWTTLALGAALVAAASAAHAQDKVIELKIATWIAPSHFMTKFLENWSKQIEVLSGGQIQTKFFGGAQMGPPPKYYDLAREGVLDVAFHLHGSTPGRFPLTELSHLPYVMPSAEVGTKVLNDRELATKYLIPEHKGVRVLYLLTHQPGNILMRSKPVRTTEDLKGQRIRFSSTTIKDWVAVLGGTPMGVPPTEQAENLQKGTLDGTFIDYGGAHTGFKLGGLVRHMTDMYSYISSFAVVMNIDAYNKLPKDLQRLIDETTDPRHVSGLLGRMWDYADAPGKEYLVKEGAQLITLSPAEDKKFRVLADKLAETKVAELEAKKLPAKEVYARMKALAEEHSKTSINFWRGAERR